ncbi:MAG TPA: hypothetical protein DEP05_05685 [Betaproteobacteria bacterium]|nr:hypothetical protein [Betaproteobacteria bacterium]
MTAVPAAIGAGPAGAGRFNRSPVSEGRWRGPDIAAPGRIGASRPGPSAYRLVESGRLAPAA